MTKSIKDSLSPTQKVLRTVSVLILSLAIIAGSFAMPSGVSAEESADHGIGEPISIPMDSEPVLSVDRVEPDTLKIAVYQDYTKAFEVLTIVNQERQKAGVAPLVMDESLLESAMQRSSETVVLMSHGRPDGTLCFTIDPKMRAENYAWGYSSAQDVMNGWMKSSGHKANILNGSYTGVGIGCIKYNGAYHWVQCFGTTEATADCEKPESGDAERAINMPYNTITDPYKNITVTFNFSITPANKSMVVGDTRDYTLVMDNVTFLDGEDSVYWRSSDETVAAVDENGVVTGLVPGSTVITASSKYLDRKSLSLNITVLPKNMRIFGSNRVDTSIEAAKKLKSKLETEKFSSVIIANGMNYADALSGSWLSTVKSAPILLVVDKSEEKVIRFVKENLDEEGTVYILGGEKAVAGSVEDSLSSFNVKRLCGENRFETNIAIMEETDISGQDLLVCSGISYPDALSVSSVGKPIMLVAGSLMDVQKDYLETACFGKIYVIGGNSAVSSDMVNSLVEYANVTRIGGKNRFETSLNVANTFFPGHHDYLMMVYAMDFPDGLSGGALAYQYDAPVILATTSNVSSAISYRGSSGAAISITMGGPKLISDEAVYTAMGNNTPIQVN